MLNLDSFTWASPAGIILLTLGFLSVVVWAVLIEKLVLVRRWSSRRDRGLGAARTAIDRGDLAEAGAALRESAHPVAPTLKFLVNSIRNAVEAGGRLEEKILYSAAIRERVDHRIDDLESRLRHRLGMLQAIAAISPSLGLLGTVIGLIETFQVLETDGGQIHPTALAGGIWSALLTTAAGLIVAIPAIAVHYLMDAAIDRVIAPIHHMVSEVETVARQRAATVGG